jgi:hypothetical protein
MAESLSTLYVVLFIVGFLLSVLGWTGGLFGFQGNPIKGKARVASVLIGGALFLVGGIPTGKAFLSETNETLAVISKGNAEAETQAARDKTEFEGIRKQIAAMPMKEELRVYYLGKLDPQKGLLGHTSEVPMENARNILKEAQAACGNKPEPQSGSVKK